MSTVSEFDPPDQENGPVSTGDTPKWRRGTFWAGWHGVRQTGWISGCWGIHKTSPRPWEGPPLWQITHLPTGFGCAGEGFSTLRVAQQYCARIDPIAEWQSADFQCVKEQLPTLGPKIKAILDELRHPEGRPA